MLITGLVDALYGIDSDEGAGEAQAAAMIPVPSVYDAAALRDTFVEYIIKETHCDLRVTTPDQLEWSMHSRRSKSSRTLGLLCFSSNLAWISRRPIVCERPR